jgi:hypothetical protein
LCNVISALRVFRFIGRKAELVSAIITPKSQLTGQAALAVHKLGENLIGGLASRSRRIYAAIPTSFTAVPGHADATY